MAASAEMSAEGIEVTVVDVPGGVAVSITVTTPFAGVGERVVDVAVSLKVVVPGVAALPTGDFAAIESVASPLPDRLAGVPCCKGARGSRDSENIIELGIKSGRRASSRVECHPATVSS